MGGCFDFFEMDILHFLVLFEEFDKIGTSKAYIEVS